MSSQPELIEDPPICPGCYCLHLYCKYENVDHGFRAFPVEVVDYQTAREAKQVARRLGWVLHQDDTATCPTCARALGLRQLKRRGEGA